MYHSISRGGSSDFATFFEALPGEIATKEANASKLLGINRLTLRKYLNHELQPPDAMTRLLFMESKYGAEHIYCQLFNEARLYAGMAEGLKKTVSALKEQLSSTEAKLNEIKANSHDHAANSDYFTPGSRYLHLNQWREFPTQTNNHTATGTNPPGTPLSHHWQAKRKRLD